jgi:hypothetical protein
VLAAGCVDEDPAPADELDTEATAPVPQTMQDFAEIGWFLAVGAPGTGQDVQLVATNAATFRLPTDARDLMVNVTWTCEMLDCPLHVYVDAEGMEVGHAAETGSAAFAFPEPTPGAWLVSVHGDALSVGMTGEIAWSFTAVPATTGATPLQT